jgi:hypothetical protein
VAARRYQLVVDGVLGGQLESAFDGMTFARGMGTTTMTGDLRDQAELQGVLQRISDLGLTLLEARAIDSGHQRHPGQTTLAPREERAVAVPESSREGS